MTNGTTTLRQRDWVVLLLLASALLLSHPFAGVRHDGILYAGDALARLQTGQFHDDLYFLYGSQGRFTLLPTFYAALISLFGIGGGTIAGLLLAFALYLAATLYLIGWLAPAPLRAPSVLAVVLGWTLYGGNRVFAYSEGFLTARSFAEPVVLFALGLMVRGRPIAAGVAILAALFIHPLAAAGGALVLWLVLAQKDRRWLWLAPIGALALAGLGASGLGPFSDVFARYDDAWLALVHEANGHAFVLRWTEADYGIVVFVAASLWFAHRTATRPMHRALIVAAGIAGLGATLASLVLVDLALNPFFGKLQIWRALWIMQWIAIASLPTVVWGLWRRDAPGRIAACLLVIGWMASFHIVAAPVALFAVAIEVFHARLVISRPTVRLVLAATIASAVAIVVQYESRIIKLGILLGEPVSNIVMRALTSNVLLMTAAIAFLVFRTKLGRVAPVIAVLVFVGALAGWDQRAAWTRSLESRPLGAHIWPGVIEPEAKVYWYRDMIAPWVLLGHANYYTQQQGSGAVFSRAMIVEADKRRHVAAILDMQEQLCRVMNNLNNKANECEPDVEAFRTICIDGEVDYVVLQNTLEGARPTAEFSTGVVENGYEKKFYLYRCADAKAR